MSKTVISVENLSKSYQLGQINTGTFSYDLKLWWAKLRGQPNPLLRIGETDHGNRDGEELWALKDVSFTVEQGEVLGIIGRNGAGKSTLLKILSRVTAPTSGRVRVKGRIASLLEVGTGFHPELTGRENIYLNGAILGMQREEITRKFDEIVDFAGVEKFIDTPVKRYSSGMYVRLAFAVAAHMDPEILIVDEVLAVGDAEFQKKCLGKMGAVANEGRTVLFVSHNMAAIERLCKKAIVLQQGSLSQMGYTNECISFYLSFRNSSDRKISDAITSISPLIMIKHISVNGQLTSYLHLLANYSDISVTIEGQLMERVKMDMEVRFYDYQGNPLGFFSPGHIFGSVEWYDPGCFVITRDIHLPKITRGEYSMSIFLADPTHSFWMEAPNAVQIIAQGTSTATGVVIDYAKGNGWVFLP